MFDNFALFQFSKEIGEIMSESLLDQADEAAGGFLTRSKKYLPTAARACLMASTLEDSWRYIREFNTYKTYFSNVWMTDTLDQDWLMANLFIWPLCFVRKIKQSVIIFDMFDRNCSQVY